MASMLDSQVTISNWAAIPQAPADKILGLNEEFLKCTDAGKISLGVGAYRDDEGKPMVLNAVREARKVLETKNLDHEYTTIAGIPSFLKQTLTFAYGENAEIIKSGRVAAVQSLSGTGACRLIGEFIAKFVGLGTVVYIPNPTWGNHLSIMANAGLSVKRYRYFDAKTRGFNFEGMMEDLLAAEDHSCFLLHACAHNPTGCDPTKEQWNQISAACTKKNHIVIFDSAYQGFASGDSEEDAYSIRKFVSDGHQIFLAQSYAKNFGLYGERVGALSIVTSSVEETSRVQSQLKSIVRAMYSSPPLYGARIVAEVLSTPHLKEMWLGECKAMAGRIMTMRHALKEELRLAGSTLSWEHVTDQIGMFCFTGLSEDQVLKLRHEYHIYCTDDGRISIAGMNTKNVAIVANALHCVTK
eukprot:CAMPEP_0119045258 /NCGR_PEP_ID=MMETSP1177-20130426/38592_1 /TAXON_ID=2985 /ORGANISM="Ochromonas sp, Strain CCMP1899" /LENGTH=411 /DNA_ID=CAMNT_0007016755 /DNA_START=51 /DNA_END=1286 /DNA_ORIENTATION=-